MDTLLYAEVANAGVSLNVDFLILTAHKQNFKNAHLGAAVVVRPTHTVRRSCKVLQTFKWLQIRGPKKQWNFY